MLRLLILILVCCQLIVTKTYQDNNSVNNVLIELIGKDFDSIGKDPEQNDHVQLEQCSPNNLLDKSLEVMTPDDYEPTDRYQVYKPIEHINDTIIRVDRMQTWINNVTKKVDEFVKTYRIHSYSNRSWY